MSIIKYNKDNKIKIEYNKLINKQRLDMRSVGTGRIQIAPVCPFTTNDLTCTFVSFVSGIDSNPGTFLLPKKTFAGCFSVYPIYIIIIGEGNYINPDGVSPKIYVEDFEPHIVVENERLVGIYSIQSSPQILYSFLPAPAPADDSECIIVASTDPGPRNGTRGHGYQKITDAIPYVTSTKKHIKITDDSIYGETCFKLTGDFYGIIADSGREPIISAVGIEYQTLLDIPIITGVPIFQNSESMWTVIEDEITKIAGCIIYYVKFGTPPELRHTGFSVSVGDTPSVITDTLVCNVLSTTNKIYTGQNILTINQPIGYTRGNIVYPLIEQGAVRLHPSTSEILVPSDLSVTWLNERSDNVQPERASVSPGVIVIPYIYWKTVAPIVEKTVEFIIIGATGNIIVSRTSVCIADDYKIIMLESGSFYILADNKYFLYDLSGNLIAQNALPFFGFYGISGYYYKGRRENGDMLFMEANYVHLLDSSFNIKSSLNVDALWTQLDFHFNQNIIMDRGYLYDDDFNRIKNIPGTARKTVKDYSRPSHADFFDIKYDSSTYNHAIKFYKFFGIEIERSDAIFHGIKFDGKSVIPSAIRFGSNVTSLIEIEYSEFYNFIWFPVYHYLQNNASMIYFYNNKVYKNKKPIRIKPVGVMTTRPRAYRNEFFFNEDYCIYAFSADYINNTFYKNGGTFKYSASQNKNNIFHRNGVKIVDAPIYSIVTDEPDVGVTFAKSIVRYNPLFLDNGIIDINDIDLRLQNEIIGDNFTSPGFGIGLDGNEVGANYSMFFGIDDTYTSIIIPKPTKIECFIKSIGSVIKYTESGDIITKAKSKALSLILMWEGLNSSSLDLIEDIYCCEDTTSRIYLQPITEPNEYLEMKLLPDESLDESVSVYTQNDLGSDLTKLAFEKKYTR